MTTHLVVVISSDTLSREEMEEEVRVFMRHGPKYDIVPKEDVILTHGDKMITMLHLMPTDDEDMEVR